MAAHADRAVLQGQHVRSRFGVVRLHVMETTQYKSAMVARGSRLTLCHPVAQANILLFGVGFVGLDLPE